MKNSVIRVSGGIGFLAAFMISDEGGSSIKHKGSQYYNRGAIYFSPIVITRRISSLRKPKAMGQRIWGNVTTSYSSSTTPFC
jgi:hypothetical protein